MATTEDGVLDFSVASAVEDVLQQQGNRSRGVDLASRRAEEACMILSFLFFLNFKIYFFGCFEY